MSPAQGFRAALAFTLGVAAVLWIATPGLTGLQGPRRSLIAELEEQRAREGVPGVQADPGLFPVAREEVARLARGLPPRSAEALERRARARGWRGQGPLGRVQVRGPGLRPAGVVEAWLATRPGREVLLDRARTRVAIAHARDDRGGRLYLALSARPSPGEPEDCGSADSSRSTERISSGCNGRH